MTEQFSNFGEYDGEAVGKALGAEPAATADVAHGDGAAIPVGGHAVLEVYPSAGVARVTTKDARIELFRVPGYAVGGEHVVFEHGQNDDRTRLMVRSDGRVSFVPVIRRPQAATTDAKGGTTEQVAPTSSPGSQPATAPQERGSPPGRDVEGGEVQPVLLTGRLGRDPWYSGEGDQPLGGFPLAVNDEQGRPTWHRVVVFGDTADALREAHAKGQIKKGRLVSVTGSEVQRVEQTAGGTPRKSREFHAQAVTRVATTRPIR